MARKTKSRSRSLTIRVARGGGKLRRAGRRGLARIKRTAHRHKHSLPLMGVGIGAAGVGYLRGAGYLKKLPVIGDSPNLTLGLIGFGLCRYTHNKYTRMAGLGALAIAAAAYGEEQGKKNPAVSGDDDLGDDLDGDEDLAGY